MDLYIYILIHDMGKTYIRGVYATLALAEAAIPETESHRGRYRSPGHNEHCCAVDVWAVQGVAVPAG